MKKITTFLLAVNLLCFLFLGAFAAVGNASGKFQKSVKKSANLLYLPLDERFTTRELFLSDAQITHFHILTPEESILPHKKSLPEMKTLLDWTEKTAKTSDVGIISAEMLLYGGLIGSRISLDSLSDVQKRLQILTKIQRENPKLRLLVSSTVTRIPAYPSSEEEPDYYAKYGREIFQFSYYSHRYEKLKNPPDKISADNFKNQIPQNILDDFLTRRERNLSINKELIKLVEKNVIERLVITLDDNSEYGFSKKEAEELEKLAAPFNNRIAVYPGADEAQLALLSNLVACGKPVSVYPAYRFPQSKNLIPAFEGEPLNESVSLQIRAAGGRVENDLSRAECILYVNNFEDKETFPAKNITELPADVEPFEQWLKRAEINSIKDKILILADNRFYNGADVELVSAIFKSNINPAQMAYASWNTSGNTLGSAISLGVLWRKMARNARNSLQFKRLLFARFIEDWVYMTIGRNRVRANLQRENLTEFEGTTFERQYELEMRDLFNSRAREINRFLKSDFEIERVFFPWHRPFEIGFRISRKKR